MCVICVDLLVVCVHVMCVCHMCRPTCCIHIYIAATRQHSSTALLHLQVLCTGMMAVQVCQLQKVIFNLPCVQCTCTCVYMYLHTHTHMYTDQSTLYCSQCTIEVYLQMDLKEKRGGGSGFKIQHYMFRVVYMARALKGLCT